MSSLEEVTTYLDATLRTADIPDYPQALNGLQLASDAPIRRVAAAVDFSSQTVDGARAAGANLLLVHHGMFWSGLQPIRDLAYRRLATLIRNDIAVYSSHLPLDVHPVLGNNALLARHLGLEPTGTFARYQNIFVGVSGASDVLTSSLVESATHLAAAHGGIVVATPHSSGRRTRAWGICTGAGASSETLAEAAARGLDTLIVGEGPHHTAVQARDMGIVVIYAGHYATETFGVQALAKELERAFELESVFIGAPSGL
jgi:dinuclear metal center YbgI/SA1388 family protein